MLGLEYVNGGSLDTYLKKPETRTTIDTKDMLAIVRDAPKGCLYLESKGYIHRDISARNCLVDTASDLNNKPQTVKLSDFRLAKDIGDETAYKSRDPTKDVLPVAWTPPEAFSGKFSSKSDVWAFGVLMWETFSFAATPFGHYGIGNTHRCKLRCLTLEEVEFNVCVEKKTLMDFPDPCSIAFRLVLKKLFSLCWQFDPDDRPSFKQLQSYLNGAASEIVAVSFPVFIGGGPGTVTLAETFVPLSGDGELSVRQKLSTSHLRPAYEMEVMTNKAAKGVISYDRANCGLHDEETVI